MTANFGSNNVTVLTKVGRGVPANANSYAVGRDPISVAVGFSTPTRFAVNTSVNPEAVGVADFNGDGKVDLAVPSGGGFSIMLGNGSGGFGAPTQFISASADSITVGDFNGDGHADLALISTSSSNKVSVVLGDGTGNFGPAVNFVVGGTPQALAVGDFNGDGHPDIAVAHTGQSLATPPLPQSVSVLFGDGAGEASAPPPASPLSPSARSSPATSTATDCSTWSPPEARTSSPSCSTPAALRPRGRLPCSSACRPTASARARAARP